MSISLRNITIALFFTSFLYSCRQENTDPVVERGKMLTNGRWKLVEAYANREKNGVHTTYDIFNNLPECEKDNILKFNSNSVIEEDQGNMKCHPNDSQVIIRENWALVGNSVLEFINPNLDTARYMSILELSAELLHLRYTGRSADSTNFEETYKYEPLLP
jgi:hypothetical protein